MFSEQIKKSFEKLKYNNIHIIKYTIIGIASITLELLIRMFLIELNLNQKNAELLSISWSILFAFYLNYKFNFDIPKRKLIRALIYFVSISICSYIFQKLASYYFLPLDRNYNVDRIITSGSIYLFVFYLHRKFSFRKFRHVGIAVYANGIEDILSIKSRIGIYADFIHVDIVDKTIIGDLSDVRSYRMETVRAAWPQLPIHTHIMSKYPSQWISEVSKVSDVIFVHDTIGEDLNKVRKKIEDLGCHFGLALHAGESYEDLDLLLDTVGYVLILAIAKPGHSGQKFMHEAYQLIRNVNEVASAKNIVVCVDGGVDNETILKFDSDQVVSGSFVLNAIEPKSQILKLQTLSE